MVSHQREAFRLNVHGTYCLGPTLEDNGEQFIWMRKSHTEQSGWNNGKRVYVVRQGEHGFEAQGECV